MWGCTIDYLLDIMGLMCRGGNTLLPLLPKKRGKFVLPIKNNKVELVKKGHYQKREQKISPFQILVSKHQIALYIAVFKIQFKLIAQIDSVLTNKTVQILGREKKLFRHLDESKDLFGGNQ